MKHNLSWAAVLLTASLGLAARNAEAGQQQDVVLSLGNGQQLPLTVILPDGYSDKNEHPMVLALAGGQGNPPLARAFLANYWVREADRRGYILLAPGVYGPSLESVGHFVLEAIFDWADEHLSYDPARVTLAGQSNGGLGAFHLARLQPERFGSIIVMPGGYGGSGDLDQLEGKPVLLLVGERDTGWVQLSQRTRDFLVLAGADPRLELVPGGGHVFPYAAAVLFDWIQLQYPD